MKVSKREGRIMNHITESWLKAEVISEQEFLKLRDSYEVVSFDWKRVARYSFWLALACIAISVTSILSDQWLIEWFKKIFNAPDFVKSIGFAVLSAGLYFLGVSRKGLYPEKIYSNEAVFFLGVLATAASITFLGIVLSTDSGHFSLLLLLAAIIYGLLGVWFQSKLVWLFALMSLGGWFGAETGYASGWGAYHLGMNYPLRFVLFGLILIFPGAYLFRQWQSRSAFFRVTRATGLTYLFIALWLMSIFGNYGDIGAWEKIRQIELFNWSLLLGLASIGAIYHGVKYDDGMSWGFGLTFIFINLYTRFFEYFWNGTHKAIFFAILAISFWFLGLKAEKIWNATLALRGRINRL